MLKGLINWQGDDSSSVATSVVGGAGSSASSAVVGNRLQQAALASTIQLLNDDEAAIETIENEDEKANRLLIQFPSYGTYSQAMNASNLNQTADWLLGGTSNIPTSQQQQQKLMMQQQQEQQSSAAGDEDSATSLPPPLNRTPNDKQAPLGPNGATPAETSSIVHRDWDEDERHLWKTNKAFSRPTVSPRGGNVSEGFGGSRINNPKEEKLRKTQHWNQQDSSNDFLSAYYFHIGVTPKISPPRSIGWAGEVTPVRSENNTLKEPSRFALQSPDRIHNANHNRSVSEPPDPIEGGMKTPELRRPISPPASGGRAPVASDVADSSTPSDDRQHWMPDQLCRVCYACDLPFTVFRRRHHCRICGQVFCSSCSGYFVPASQQQVQQQQGHAFSILSSGTHIGNSTAASNNKTILRTCKMCYEQVTAQQQQMIVEEEAADAKRKRNKEDPLSVTPVADIADAKRKQQQSTPLGAKQRQAGDSPSLQDQLENGDSVLHSLSKKRAETEFAKRRLWSQQQVMEEEEKEQSTLLGSKRQGQSSAQINRGLVPPSSPTRPDIAKHGTQDTADGNKSKNGDDAKLGIRHLGLTAATHLEKMGEALLASDAPLLWKEVDQQSEGNGTPNRRLRKKWVNKIMSLATRCCSTVEPNVKKGDLLDIRPYCKIKVIPGGSYEDCAYLSGVVFRKTLSHKRMAKEIDNPRIMLLSGGIEFTRTENRFASLDTLLEQEDKYMEILVGKIIKLKPDILLVGRSVSRRAQELLLKARVVLVQHVKSTLLSRISRQTGATIISSTDHIMNQFGAHVLGRCNRFRFIVARDNEKWMDFDENSSPNGATPGLNERKNIEILLHDPELSHHERQAALAANMLGEDVLDGSEAVKCGLSKRGVALTYVLLEGCPKQLGCTVVLRGASRAALKQVKLVFRFLVNVAYNLRLETSYFRERGARLRPAFEVRPEHLFSSSLCVDYGKPSGGRKIRPWNGGTNNEGSQRSISGQITAFDHQSILITSVWMTDKTQCCPAEVKGICYYSLQDVSLGQFLRDSCFNLSLKCQNPTCKKSVLDHSLSFVHKDGLINITVDHLEDPLPPAPLEGSRKRDDSKKEDDDETEEVEDRPIATWTYCSTCGKVVTDLEYISESTWKYSFGKFLESFFYNGHAVMNTPEHGCTCDVQGPTTLFFGCGKLAARFTYERVRPFGVFVRRSLPIDPSFHRAEALRQLEQISMASSLLFVKFDKHIEKVSRDTRSLFGSAANRPEHLQTVLSELNKIGSEVDHAAKTLQEKIASVSDKCSKEDDRVVNEALFRFPWFSRRYLFMLTSAWNEKLSAAGQAIVAMKKLASSASLRGDSVMGPNVPAIVGDPNTEDLNEGIRRLRQLREVYSRYNLTDITTVLPILPGSANSSGNNIEFDDDFEDPDGALDFADGVDADVLASRRRLHNAGSTHPHGDRSNESGKQRPTKSLGTRRSEDKSSLHQRVTPDTIPNSAVTTKVTPGGAVKSAITRFFNRGGRESDPYVVDLGMFGEGRPRLEPGVNGIVVPVVDEQLSTIIAYSLSSTEYATQFKDYSKAEASTPDTSSQIGISSEAGASSVGGGSQHRGRTNNPADTPSSQASGSSSFKFSDKHDIERRMLVRNKSHIKHTFRDFDEKGQNLCKFVCTSYWATQFQAVRQVFLATHGAKEQNEGNSLALSSFDIEQAYVQSLSNAYRWAASGGKSGASFARTSDDRFVIKCISKTELQMFLDCAPAYFEYLSKAFFHGLPTVLCKVVGVYQIGYHNRVTGKRSMDQVAVMQNIFYNRKITKTFDLKGSLRGRFAAQVQSAKDDGTPDTPLGSESSSGHRKRGSDVGIETAFPRFGDGDSEVGSDGEDGQGAGSSSQGSGTLLDGDFLDFTMGRPMPLNDRAKAVFHMSILNDTLFLSIINVLDYSILVGTDEEKGELVVGIIDFFRQYDILKQMERVGKSLPMVVGSEAPTIIQPPLYKARFTNAMERYFMTVPSKWTAI